MYSNIYTVDGREFELKHYGVKGMKWGRRKARPDSNSVGRRGRQATTDSPEAQAAAKAARQQKAKRALKIGTAVVGTALAAYGAKKLHDAVRDKHVQLQMQKGSRQVRYILRTTGVDKYWKSPAYEAAIRATRNNARADSFGVAAKNVAGHYRSEIKRKIDKHT